MLISTFFPLLKKITNKPKHSYFIFSSICLIWNVTLQQPPASQYYFSFIYLTLAIEFFWLSFYKTFSLDIKITFSKIILLISYIAHVYLISIQESIDGIDFFKGLEAVLFFYLNFKLINKPWLKILVLIGTIIFYFVRFASFVPDLSKKIYYYLFISICACFLACYKEIEKRNNQKKNFQVQKKVSTQSKLEKDLSLINTKESKRNLKSFKELENDTEKEVFNESKKKIASFENNEPNFVKSLSSSTGFDMINALYEGVFLINESKEILYMNSSASFFFEETDPEKLSHLILSLKEDFSYFPHSNFKNIPDLTLQSMFKVLQMNKISSLQEVTPRSRSNAESFESCDDKDYISMKSKRSEPIKLFNSSHESFTDFATKETFNLWPQHFLNDNGDFFNFSLKNLEKTERKLKTLENYLNRLFRFCKRSSNMGNNSTKFNSFSEFPVYNMYSFLREPVSINFYPLSVLPDQPNKKNSILILIRKISEEELQILRQDNIKSKNLLLGSFCHELRTPLNAILNMLDLSINDIEKCDELDAGVKLNITNSIINSNLLLSSIDDFIDYFSLSNNLIEVDNVLFNLNSLLEDVYNVYVYMCAKKNLELLLEYDAKIPVYIKSDPKKIKQILFNLLSNSVRYTFKGSILVKAIMKEQGEIELSVLDSGIGINVSDFHKLGKLSHKKYEQENKPTCGFGLFIANFLTNQICPLEDSEKRGIKVHSEISYGTRFSFIISDTSFDRVNEEKTDQTDSKCTNEDKNDSSSILMDAEPNIDIKKNDFEKQGILYPKFLSEYICTHPKKCKKVLIVDDSPFNLEIWEKFFKKFDIQSEKANNGIEAIYDVEQIILNPMERFCENCKFYSVILMDIDMPIKDGIETTKSILKITKNENFHVNIVAVSAFHQEEIKKKSIEAGMIAYYEKPLTYKKVEEIIRLYFKH